jgi:hypothetical protein
MMVKIARAAIVRTPRAGQADLGRGMVVGLFHLGIKLGQLFKQGPSLYLLLLHPKAALLLSPKMAVPIRTNVAPS